MGGREEESRAKTGFRKTWRDIIKGYDRSEIDKGTTSSNASLEVNLRTTHVVSCNNYGEQTNMEGEENTGEEMEIVLDNSYDREFQTNKAHELSPTHESIPPHIIHNI